jgi:hypothetical protein
MELEAEESIPTPTTSQYVEQKAQSHIEIGSRDRKQQQQEDQLVYEGNATASGSGTTVSEADQPAELRLSDFQVVDTLGKPALFHYTNADMKY